MKIICGIITYNREKLLHRCIFNINKLSIKPNLILIINQGNNINLDLDLDFNIKIINQENAGSAGGWHTAINYAINNNFNYIWLMDDDGFPEKKSLELLLNNFKSHYSCLSSVVLNEKKKEELVFSMPNYKNNYITRTKNIKTLRKLTINSKKNLYPFAHLFNGSLISIKAIKNIGNITKNLYIYGEEVDYFYRLNNFGPVLTHLDSKHFHPHVKKKFTSDEKIYYWIRNTIINNNNYSNRKIFKNFISFFVTIFRILERNGIIYLIKLFSINCRTILIKAIIDARNFKPKQ